MTRMVVDSLSVFLHKMTDQQLVREKVFQRFPFMRSSAFERRMLFERKDERGPQPRMVAGSHALKSAHS